MNNIIKQINYNQQSKEILGYDNLIKFIGDVEGHTCIFFVADWSVPSRLLYKRIRKISCNRKKVAFVDVDLVDNIELCEKYKVTKVPHCLVFKHNAEIEFEFIGLDIEKLNDSLLKYNAISEISKEEKQKKCPNGHQLIKLTELQFPPYINNFFFCNRCKKIDKCQPQKNEVLHCEECDYDMCQYCQITSH